MATKSNRGDLLLAKTRWKINKYTLKTKLDVNDKTSAIWWANLKNICFMAQQTI